MIYRSVWKDFSNWFLFVNYWTVWSLRTLVRLLKHAPRYLNTRIVDASSLRDTEEQDNNGVSFPEFIHYYTDNESRREPHIGNNMKSCAIRAQLITILLVTLRLCRRRRSPA